MRLKSVVVLSLLVVAVLQAEEPKPKVAEPKGLTGSWRVIVVEGLGVRKEGAQAETWVFDKDVLTIHGSTGRKEAQLTYLENTKTMEFEWTREARAGDPPPKPEPGIFKIKDGKLLLCYCSSDPFGGGPRERPKEFAGPVAEIGKCSFTFYTLEPVGKDPPK